MPEISYLCGHPADAVGGDLFCYACGDFTDYSEEYEDYIDMILARGNDAME